MEYRNYSLKHPGYSPPPATVMPRHWNPQQPPRHPHPRDVNYRIACPDPPTKGMESPAMSLELPDLRDVVTATAFADSGATDDGPYTCLVCGKPESHDHGDHQYRDDFEERCEFIASTGYRRCPPTVTRRTQMMGRAMELAPPERKYFPIPPTRLAFIQHSNVQEFHQFLRQFGVNTRVRFQRLRRALKNRAYTRAARERKRAALEKEVKERSAELRVLTIQNAVLEVRLQADIERYEELERQVQPTIRRPRGDGQKEQTAAEALLSMDWPEQIE